MQQVVRQIGEPGWTRQDIKAAVGEFVELYPRKPISNNTGGMKAPHMFAAWFIARWLQPKVIVESGVFRGQSTWLLEQAAPEARLICIEPNLEGIEYRSPRASYQREDFASQDWADLPREDTLLFFDDHQNAMERIRQVKRLGFRHAMFEDNYPAGHGDCYSLKRALMQDGYVPPELRGAGLYRKLRFRVSRTAPRAIPAGPADARWLQANLTAYYEFPPVFKPETTRWNDPWTDDRYPTPEPIFTSADAAEAPPVFRDEARDYTWFCYVRL
jgi:hypothetical protein